MPIPNPILDDRSYQQLRDELVRRIPVYTPEWTDHNASDPGITLLELFAFLGENLLYRFNQIPETARLEFLRLLQIPLRPARAARTIVTMTTEKPKGVLVPLHSALKAGAMLFETMTEVKAWPVSILAVARVQTEPPDAQKEPEVKAFADQALRSLGPLPSGQQPAYYKNQIVDLMQPPVDFGATVDGKLWIAVLKEKGAEPKDLGAALLNFGFALDPVFAAMEQINACPGAGFMTPTPAVEWKISTGKLKNNQPQYQSLTPEGDTTRGLSQDGVIRLRLPKNADDFGLFSVGDPDQLGTGDFPPVLDGEAEKKLLCWLQAFRRDGSRLGKVLFLGANAAEVTQTQKARPEFLGTGTAQPDQRYKLVNKPVIAGSITLEVEEAGRWMAWQEVDGFYASQPDERHFVVDLEAGEVRFGNGLQGLPPQIGQRIRVTEYRYGGGAEGNVAPKAIAKLDGIADIKKVENPLRAQGGAPAEAIREALHRIPGELRRRDRAVTASDFQELALATPGADVGRAECLPRFHAPTKRSEAAGVVSVVVWPREDAAHPNAPMPDRRMLRAVCEWLDQRRLVTTELYVIPPTYRRIAVAVGLQVKPGYGIEAVRHWVELVLRQYLAPLPPYGPEGQGWPLGRHVIGAELEAAALQVEGVQFLTGLKVAWQESGETIWRQGSARLTNGVTIANSVELNLYEVPELTAIAVIEGPLTIEPGQNIDAPATGVPLPIPIIREEC
ncbi:MAG: putative baseplate assembly protein [Blastocatellia bacterium]|nr:putative baseplate assembly protein [Blastocatellia bacterium]